MRHGGSAGNYDRMGSGGLKLCLGMGRLGIGNKLFAKRAGMQWPSCPGSGGSTILSAVPELWRCGTEGRGDGHGGVGWAEEALGSGMLQPSP